MPARRQVTWCTYELRPARGAVPVVPVMGRLCTARSAATSGVSVSVGRQLWLERHRSFPGAAASPPTPPHAWHATHLIVRLAVLGLPHE